MVADDAVCMIVTGGKDTLWLPRPIFGWRNTGRGWSPIREGSKGRRVKVIEVDRAEWTPDVDGAPLCEEDWLDDR